MTVDTTRAPRCLIAQACMTSLAMGCSTPVADVGVFDTPTTTAADGTGSTSADPADQSSSGGTTDPVLDIGGGPDTANPDGTAGCARIDFLFVIDTSGSMEEEQAALRASFDGFVAQIEQTIGTDDFHVMVVDASQSPSTDAESYGWSDDAPDVIDCTVDPVCCIGLCDEGTSEVPASEITSCNGEPCSAYPDLLDGCDLEFGAGNTLDQTLLQRCAIEGDRRFLTRAEPDLLQAFSCVASMPVGGGAENPIGAMFNAFAGSAETGCNEGFLRSDATLVVTIITDDDDYIAEGFPPDWAADLAALKGDQEEAITVLGLLGNNSDPACNEGVGDSPLLRAFVESFTHGQEGSVCAKEYASFFEAAVAPIAESCENFVPEG